MNNEPKEREAAAPAQEVEPVLYMARNLHNKNYYATHPSEAECRLYLAQSNLKNDGVEAEVIPLYKIECKHLLATYKQETDDIDKILEKLGLPLDRARTDGGSLHLPRILNHIQETLDALGEAQNFSKHMVTKYTDACNGNATAEQAAADMKRRCIATLERYIEQRPTTERGLIIANECLEYIKAIPTPNTAMEEMRAALLCMNPRKWTKEMHDAWLKALPNTRRAFADLHTAAIAAEKYQTEPKDTAENDHG